MFTWSFHKMISVATSRRQAVCFGEDARLCCCVNCNKPHVTTQPEVKHQPVLSKCLHQCQSCSRSPSKPTSTQVDQCLCNSPNPIVILICGTNIRDEVLSAQEHSRHLPIFFVYCIFVIVFYVLFCLC